MEWKRFFWVRGRGENFWGERVKPKYSPQPCHICKKGGFYPTEEKRGEDPTNKIYVNDLNTQIISYLNTIGWSRYILSP